MLQTLLGAFLGTNINAKPKKAGPKGHVRRPSNSFLSGQKGGGFSMVDPISDVSKFTKKVNTPRSPTARITATQTSARFPEGSNATIRRALANYKIQKILQDASVNAIGNTTIKIDDYKENKYG